MTIEHEIISYSIKRNNEIKKKLDSTLKKLADTTTALDDARRENRELRRALADEERLHEPEPRGHDLRQSLNSIDELHERCASESLHASLPATH